MPTRSSDRTEFIDALRYGLPWAQDTVSFARFPYPGCLSIGVLGPAIVSAMPRLIEPDEIARPFCSVREISITFDDRYSLDMIPFAGFTTNDPLNFDPPLPAGRSFSTIARYEALPPMDWDF